MEISEIGPGGFASSCYLVTQGRDAVLIDCSAPVSVIEQALQKQNATLHGVICTHGHFDHVLTVDEVRAQFGVPLYLHRNDAELLSDGHKNAFSTFFGIDRTWMPAERLFSEGDTLTLGSLSFTVLHTPGHTPGSSILLAEQVAFTGDTLFVGGVGRTDLYGGDQEQLLASLKRLSSLPGTLTVYPGHGACGPLSLALSLF
ncbi:MAG: MBL fold metallo-hydrolase [Clostridia bacterium]|nr:MBL fold metallo-hydrolase [Clostridia bacterium]